MLRIETETDGPLTVLRLIGRIRAESVDQLRQELVNCTPQVALDLAEVNLVDVVAVRFLCDCQDRAIELRNVPAYIAEWIRRERAETDRC
jgi:ABC-type transporter Mla MlaB component